ncbi:membrane-bound lytic murein transglycosylase D [Bacteroidales bacterium]|nr:membrane-bound lytic murein transglycosylase D [Bacteroidales bacterium]
MNMMKISLLSLAFFAVTANAQETYFLENEQSVEIAPFEVAEADTVRENDLFIPESLDANVDSLLTSWHIKYYTKRQENNLPQETIFTSDSAYVERLSRLPRIMELSYNPEVRRCIDLYVERRRSLVEYMLGLADFYFPMIEQTLDKYDLPIELKFLAIVESALNPVALSRAGASGLWQFMLPTGKMYGLEINSLIDERRDPIKSTDAACRYLRDMYKTYGDWNLVIAAYNCGPGNVNKAIRRSGGKTDYWSIYQHLPKETRSYVPLFIAANYVMNYYGEHNLFPVETSLPMSTDTLMIEKQLHLDQVAAVLNVDKDLLKSLNPQYKRDIIPGNSKPYVLRLPTTDVFSFVDMQDSIFAHRYEDLFPNRTYVVAGKGNTRSANQQSITHRVKKGETMNGIAHRYGVSNKQIRSWNGLTSNSLSAGKNLKIVVNNGGVAIAAPNAAIKPLVADAKQADSPVGSAQADQNQSFLKYKVRSGDSFYSISKKYQGTSAKELMQINNMSNASLKIGQIIKVPAV